MDPAAICCGGGNPAGGGFKNTKTVVEVADFFTSIQPAFFCFLVAQQTPGGFPDLRIFQQHFAKRMKHGSLRRMAPVLKCTMPSRASSRKRWPSLQRANAQTVGSFFLSQAQQDDMQQINRFSGADYGVVQVCTSKSRLFLSD